jgi:PKD repeat protein
VSGASAVGGGGFKYSVVLVSGVVANQPPTARFTSTCQQLHCSLDGSGSTDSDGVITAYAWDFGDGSVGSGSTTTHDFAASGTYPVTLTVTDDDNATGTVTAQVTVSDASPPPGIALDGVGMSNGNVKQPSVQLPGTVASGDELVLFVSTGRNANAVAPAGWTRQKTVTNGVLRTWVFTAVAGAATAGSTVQINLDATSQTSLTVFAYAGAGVPSVIQGASQAGNLAKHKTPAGAVATAGSTVLSYWVDTGSTTHSWSLPANVTSRSTTAGTGSGLVTSAAGDTSAQPTGTWPGATADAGNTSAVAAAVWTVVLPPA